MSKKISRRSFIKLSALTAAAGFKMSVLPQPAKASSPLKAIVNLELSGGLDSFGVLSPTDGSVNDLLQQKRGDIYWDPAKEGRDLGFGQNVALSSYMTPLVPYLEHTKIYLNCSNALQEGQTRSHFQAQKIMATGSGKIHDHEGWKAKLYAMKKAELFGFQGAKGINFYCNDSECKNNPPLVVDTFETMDHSAAAFWKYLGGQSHTDLTVATIRALADTQGAGGETEMEKAYRSALKNSFQYSSKIKQYATFTTPNHEAYESTSGIDVQLAQRFRNIAQTLLRYKSTGQGGLVLFSLGKGGFDVHGDYQNKMSLLMNGFVLALRVFIDDLIQMEMFDSTTIFTSTDFGRQTHFNGQGTDHGDGSVSLVFGGRVDGGPSGRRVIHGEPLSVADIKNRDAAPARFDTRNIVADCLEDAGVSARDAFSPSVLSQFTRVNTRLFG